jgi:hypothetical protein
VPALPALPHAAGHKSGLRSTCVAHSFAGPASRSGPCACAHLARHLHGGGSSTDHGGAPGAARKRRRTHFWVSPPQVRSGTATHRGFGGGNARKPCAAPASSNAAAATGSGDLHAEENRVRTMVNASERMAMASAVGWKLWLAPALHVDRQWDDGGSTSSAQGLRDIPGRCEQRPTQNKRRGQTSGYGGLTTAATALGQALGGSGARRSDRCCRDGGGFGVLCPHVRGHRQCRPGRPIWAQRMEA